MVYKPSVKYGSARVCVEMPNVSQALLEAILGAEISRAAAKGPKQVKVRCRHCCIGLRLYTLC